MTTSTRISNPTVTSVEVTEDLLCVSLSDGREVKVPLSWYPRLAHATATHRARWELIGQGHGIHWPELDEDISVENLLLGQPSGEGARSFLRWRQWYQQKLAGSGGAPTGVPATPDDDSESTHGRPQ